MSGAIGLFGVSEDHIENYQSLDERFIKSKSSTFSFQADSEAMSPYVLKGDILIVDRSLTPINGQVIVAALDGEMICRRILYSHSSISLKSDNEKYRSLVVYEESDFIIWGVVKALARDVLCP